MKLFFKLWIRHTELAMTHTSWHRAIRIGFYFARAFKEERL